MVDTVGAGDGFAVGMISALLENLSFAEAVQRGNWIGSRAVQSRGIWRACRPAYSVEFEAAIREQARSHTPLSSPPRDEPHSH